MRDTTTYWLELNRKCLMMSIQLVMEELETHFSKSNKKEIFTEVDASSELLEEILEKIPSKPNLEILVEKFKLSEFEKKMLLVCAGIELNSNYSAFISKLQGNATSVFPSFNLLLAGLELSHWDAISPASPLRKWNLIHLNSGSLLANQPIKIDEGILHYLTGISFLEEHLASVVKKENEEFLLTKSQEQLVSQIVIDYTNNSKHQKIIELNGDQPKDKIAVAKKVSESLGYTLFKIDALSVPSKMEDVIFLEKLWNRQALLNRYAIFIDCTNSSIEEHSNYSTLNHFANNCNGLTFIDREMLSKSLSITTNIYKVNKPTLEEQINLWTNLLVYGEENTHVINSLVQHFNLATQTIKIASQEINESNEQENLKSVLWKTCCEKTRPAVDHLAHRIETLATWDDIVLPKEDLNTLKEITMQVKYRSKVYNEGGFAKKQSRGLGISVLFSGESGTGKTMAAEVIANDLNLDLYRIDLSQIKNKFVGESEKNIKKVFDSFEDGGAILLFDEADSLFGKRGEVQDSHDSHKNFQIGYLLQRMENFNGLAILTTNMKNAIDKAFERRIRFSVNFERPNLQHRRKIWEKAFPNQAWVNGVDYKKLALANIPGGNIKNIAMNAAFLAASEDSKIGMNHLLQATKNEYKKVDRHLSNSEIKDWE